MHWWEKFIHDQWCFIVPYLTGLKTCLFNGTEHKDLLNATMVNFQAVGTADIFERVHCSSINRLSFLWRSGTFAGVVGLRWMLVHVLAVSLSCVCESSLLESFHSDPIRLLLLCLLDSLARRRVRGKKQHFQFTCFSRISSKLTSVRPMSLGSVFSASISPSSTTFSPRTTKTPRGMSP